MTNVLLAFAALVAWILLYNLTWYIIEIVHPLEYGDLSFADLEEHFGELYRRGKSKSQMIVTEQATGKSVRLRKHFPSDWSQLFHGSVGSQISLDLIADGVTRQMSWTAVRTGRCTEHGIRCGFRLEDTKEFAGNLICHCLDKPELAVQATRVVFCQIHGLPEDARFKLRVKGFVRVDTGVYHGAMTWAEARWNPALPGKPYKRWQVKGGFFYWGGRLTGVAASWLQRLFYPRGPGDNLMK